VTTESDFAKLDPGDGVRIQRVENGDEEVSLHVLVKGGGDMLHVYTTGDRPEDASEELFSWLDPTAADRGDCDRLEAVLDAVARFLTCGGHWDQLGLALGRMKRLVPSGLIFSGWHYHSGELVYDPDLERSAWQHVFVSDADAGEFTPAVVWLEGVFIDQKTLGQVLRERQHDEEEENDRDGGGTVRPELQLPDPPDPEVKGLPYRGSEG
jgi:hypothetical protein